MWSHHHYYIYHHRFDRGTQNSKSTCVRRGNSRTLYGRQSISTPLPPARHAKKLWDEGMRSLRSIKRKKRIVIGPTTDECCLTMNKTTRNGGHNQLIKHHPNNKKSRLILMSSDNNSSNNRSVRFASVPKTQQEESSLSFKRARDEMEDAGPASENPSSAMKKSKKHRPNEDELDDIDDWKKEDDYDQEESVPSERELLEAKRRRREQRDGDGDGGHASSTGDERTHIDDVTSLATEGIAIEPFNMDQERTDGTGYFEGDTYVFRHREKEDEEPDAWLDSLKDDDGKEKDMTSSRVDKASGNGDTDSRITAMVLNKQTMKRKAASVNMDDWSREELYTKILPLVSDTETVTQAVRRYGLLLKRKQHGKTKNGKPKDDSAMDQDDASHPELAKTCLDDLTGAANALLFKGDVDIYDSTRNDILKRLPRQLEGEEPQKTLPKQPQANWEYMGNQDGQVHGPYSTEQMLGWTQAGYFVGAQQVKIRTIRLGKPLSTKDDLLADLMDDDDDDDSKTNGNLVKGEWQSSNDVDFKSYLQ